jgi:hypothetical protein
VRSSATTRARRIASPVPRRTASTSCSPRPSRPTRRPYRPCPHGVCRPGRRAAGGRTARRRCGRESGARPELA